MNLACFRVEGQWNSEGMAVYGYSFWLTVLACLGFIINIAIIATATWHPNTRRKVDKVKREASVSGVNQNN